MIKKQAELTPKARRERTTEELDRDQKWGTEASRIVKAAMKRRGMNAVQLAELLTENGRPTEPQALRNLLSAGKFKAAWFLDTLILLGEKEIKL